MAGYDLKAAEYDGRTVSDDELWSALSYIFSSQSRNDTSYKFGFFKAIIDNLYNIDDDLRLSFDQLFTKFAEIYWNLILKYKLRQKAKTKDNKQTYLEQIIKEAVVKYEIAEGVLFENLPEDIRCRISHQVKMKCKACVVGALYMDTNRLFYSFSKKEEYIQINPQMYTFICKHKVIIEKMNYFEWAKFLEKVNEDFLTFNLLGKLDESSKRSNLSIYRWILFNQFEQKTCFYCNKPLIENKAEVDHFIPWVFIKDDKLWNLVLACKKCNRSKTDKLPSVLYLDSIRKRNDSLLIHSKQADMKNYKKEKLDNIYHWAESNGYHQTWEHKEN